MIHVRMSDQDRFQMIQPLTKGLLAQIDSGIDQNVLAPKFSSFCYEIDANVFPCLGNREGCYRLMREIARRDGFLPNATWLLETAGEDGTFKENRMKSHLLGLIGVAIFVGGCATSEVNHTAEAVYGTTNPTTRSTRAY